MRIAMIGVRGVPVIYSGFETLAEKLSTGLVRKGHKVTVYSRKGYVDPERKTYRGVKIITLPSIRSKNWETFVHSFVSTLHACIKGKYDLIYFIGVGSTIFSLVPRILGTKTAVNVDGLDWRREKWGSVGKAYLALSEALACLLPNVVITDSLYIKRYYKRKYGKDTVYLPYGYEPNVGKDRRVLGRFGLSAGKYIVWVGRLVPDNHTDELIRAFETLKTSLKCVIVGDDRLNGEYKNKIRTLAANDNRMVFTGFLDREEYTALVKNALCYIETKRSGGTHPSLVEAMGFGTLIISNNHSANREVVGSGAIYYRKGSVRSLAGVITAAIRGRDTMKLRKISLNIARTKYSWAKIIKQYEAVFKSQVNI